MKNCFSLAATGLLLFVTACSCFKESQNQSDPTPSPNANTTSAEKVNGESTKAANSAPEKPLDFIALVGKSEADVKKVLGPPLTVSKLNSTDRTGDLSYDFKFPRGHGFINFKKGKVNYLHFESDVSFETYFQLGDLVGADLRGVVPTTANSAQVAFVDATVSGVKFKEIRVMSDGRYKIITILKENVSP